jgi:hypothetical protein
MTTSAPPPASRRSTRISIIIVLALSIIIVLALLVSAIGLRGATADHGVLEVDTTATPEDLVALLLGPGIPVVAGSVNYTGHADAAGTFDHGQGIINFGSGVVLSTGLAADVIGPNTRISTADGGLKGSTNLGQPGDAALTTLSGFATFDAAILEFEFDAPQYAERVSFNYVFGSEEYNEWVGTQFNDVFAFWVNGVNCAIVDGDPVTVNNINNNVNSHLFIDNTTGGDFGFGHLNTELDGLTVVLTCEADVMGGATNTVSLAIADAGDAIVDSTVFIQAGSFTFERCVDLVADQETVVGTVCATQDGEDLVVTYVLSDSAIADGWVITETHLHVGQDPDLGDFPLNRAGNPQIGHFADHSSHDPGVTSHSVTVTDLDPGDVFIGAHAVIEIPSIDKDTAWGGVVVSELEETDGVDSFPGANWAMYFEFSLIVR